MLLVGAVWQLARLSGAVNQGSLRNKKSLLPSVPRLFRVKREWGGLCGWAWVMIQDSVREISPQNA
jgi:hypothetical protein